MPNRVFVSYSRNDVVLVKTISDYLGQFVTVFLDTDDLIAGVLFKPAIARKIKRSNVVLIFWSASASTASWVEWEIQQAIKSGRHIIPVLLDETPLGALVAHLEAVDLRNWDGSFDAEEVSKLARDTRLEIHDVTSGRFRVPVILGVTAAVVILLLCVIAILNYESTQAELPTSTQTSVSQSSTSSSSSAFLPVEVSSAKLGVDYLLGLGTELNVEKGLQLLADAMKPPGDFSPTLGFLERGLKNLNRSDFVEIIKTINLLAHDYPAPAEFVEGVFAAHGYTHPACALPCLTEAKQHASKLNSLGRSDLAGLIEKTIIEQQPTKIGFEGRPTLQRSHLFNEIENGTALSERRGLFVSSGSSHLNGSISRENRPRPFKMIIR